MFEIEMDKKLDMREDVLIKMMPYVLRKAEAAENPRPKVAMSLLTNFFKPLIAEAKG